MLKNILLLSLQMSLLGVTLGGNVLIWPMEGSHWLNIKIIIDELIRKQHNVTVLASSGALFIKPTHTPSLTFEVYKVAFDQERTAKMIRNFVLTWMENRPTPSTIWRFYHKIGEVLEDFHMISRENCDGVIKNQKLMGKLKKSKFEVLVSDPVFPCGDIIALKLGIPFMYTLRFSPASTVEKHCGKTPYPPSYVPAILSELTDQMPFTDRIRNFISYHLQDYMFNSLWKSWDSYYSEALVSTLLDGEDTTKTKVTFLASKILQSSEKLGMKENIYNMNDVDNENVYKEQNYYKGDRQPMTGQSSILKTFRVELIHKEIFKQYEFSQKPRVGKETVCPILWSLEITRVVMGITDASVLRKVEV